MISLALDKKSFDVLRYALGSTILVAIVMLTQWPLGYILPVLALSFLASGGPSPTMKSGVLYFLAIALAMFFGLWLTKQLLPYPIVLILAMSLVIFSITFTQKSIFSPFVKTFMLIACLLVPILGLLMKEVAVIVTYSLVFNAAMAIILVWMVFFFFPFKPNLEKGVAAKQVEKGSLTRLIRHQAAMRSVLVIMPLALAYMVFDWTSSVLTLIFVALLGMQPAFQKGLKAGGAMILGNTLGGLVAIICYELMTVVPELPFFLMIILLVGLIFGRKVFSGKPSSALYGMAFSTFLLIICSSVLSDSTDAGEKVWERVILIFFAVIYVAAVFAIINAFSKE